MAEQTVKQFYDMAAVWLADAGPYHSEAERRQWLGILRRQIQDLQEIGWSLSAIKDGYLSLLVAECDVELLEESFQQAQIFGDPIFLTLFGQQVKQAQTVSQAQKIVAFVIDKAGMPDELLGTTEQIQAILAQWDWGNLTPHHDFWGQFSYLVDLSFPENRFSDKHEMALFKRRLHQFRYVISAQQAEWVRWHYQEVGMTDEEALAVYLATKERKGWSLLPVARYDLHESARLHNKKLHNKKANRVATSQDVQGVNYKILLDFHTEFIIGSQGQFFNEVDPQGQSIAGIVNGASFNYATRNNQRHRQLDIDPAGKWDPAFRKKILEAVDQPEEVRYRSPSQKEYRRKSSSFSEEEFSLYQAVKKEIAHMKYLIKEYKKNKL